MNLTRSANYAVLALLLGVGLVNPVVLNEAEDAGRRAAAEGLRLARYARCASQCTTKAAESIAECRSKHGAQTPEFKRCVGKAESARAVCLAECGN
jgi:hypothetical protein